MYNVFLLYLLFQIKLHSEFIMNNQLIKKIITSNGVPCPEFTFQNPLLDKDVAEALSKSFVRILNVSQQYLQLHNLRLPILENIRRLCRTQLEHHINLDDNTTTLLSELYIQKIKDSGRYYSAELTEKELDAFLIRNIKEIYITSRYKPPLDPEILHAFKNLNLIGVNQNTLLKDIIHLDSTDHKIINIMKDLWTEGGDSSVMEDVSVKMKPKLEQLLLEICHSLFIENITSVEEIFVSNASLQNIIKMSSSSANCFQICCSIFHYIFVNTNFNMQMQRLIQMFVEHIKHNCHQSTFSILYPTHLMHIVVLLDTQLELLHGTKMHDTYVEEICCYLKKLHLESENDFMMLLCHFPQWHDIYFNRSMTI